MLFAWKHYTIYVNDGNTVKEDYVANTRKVQDSVEMSEKALRTTHETFSVLLSVKPFDTTSLSVCLMYICVREEQRLARRLHE